MRKLIYIRVMHSSSETRFGFSDPERDRQVEILWELIKKEVQKLNLDYKKVKIYQDSFCFHDDFENLKMMAAKGSRNLRFVLKLIRNCATLIETENPELITLVSLSRGNKEEIVKLREPRDRYMARRIRKTLKNGETGILITGANHDVGDYLPKDIKVLYLRQPEEFLVELLKKERAQSV